MMLPLPLKIKEPAAMLYSAIVLAAGLSFLFAVMVSRSCSSDGDDALQAEKNAELDRIEMLIKQNEECAKRIQGEIDGIHLRVNLISDEIEQGAKERDELHGVVDGAGSIRELDRILKKRKRERSN